MRHKPTRAAKKDDIAFWNDADIFRNNSPPVSPISSRSTALKKRAKCIRGHPIPLVNIQVIGNWTVKYIAMAGKLLRKPPLAIQFGHEEEMRKVYSLIYDVFRYKNVLNEALTDIGFFAYYPELKSDQNRVWLLLFELYVRHFLERHPDEADLQILVYQEADLEGIATRLWEHRLKLAAAISRLRIRNGALKLSQLLPQHLKDERIKLIAENPVVSGWINPYKLSDIATVAKMLERLGMVEVPSDESDIEPPLQPGQYRWDKLCPLFISCIPVDRSKFAQSDIVKKNIFVMQDKTFSVAPAIVSRLLDFFDLEGDIAQTHVASPRSTAYLAALFYSVNRINSFLAFGAGSDLVKYKNYMNSLGVTNVRLHSENFNKILMESRPLQLVVGIFATPPNSFSGLADPIDLICSRGGDLNMLEELTESNISLAGKNRVASLLEEQKETLRLALSHPKVQFVLYETHSIVGSENQDMIQQAVEDINEHTFEKHLLIHKDTMEKDVRASLDPPSFPSPKSSRPPPNKRVANKKTKERGSKKKPSTSSRSTTSRTGSLILSNTFSSPHSPGEMNTDSLHVPNADQFIIADIPDCCMNDDTNVSLSSFGCYISLVRRKEITKLGEELLAQIAEQKRLRGGSERSKLFQQKQAMRVKGANDAGIKDVIRSKKTIATMVERLSRPTHASMIRAHMQNGSAEDKKHPVNHLMADGCTKHKHRNTDECCSHHGATAYMATMHLDPRAKRWWQETAHYIHNLRLLEKRKKRILAEKPDEMEIRPIELSYSYVRNDERGATHNNFAENRPRMARAIDRKAFPVTINQLEFKGYQVLKNGHPSFFHSPKTASFQITHRPVISRRPLGRCSLRDSQLLLSY